MFFHTKRKATRTYFILAIIIIAISTSIKKYSI